MILAIIAENKKFQQKAKTARITILWSLDFSNSHIKEARIL